MSYHVKLTVRATGDLAAKGGQAIVESLSEALWPEDDDSGGLAGCSEGYVTECSGDRWAFSQPEASVVEVLVYRELGDDYPCVEHEQEYQALPLTEALQRQFLEELAERQLGAASLSVVSVVVNTESMKPAARLVLADAAQAWEAERAWRAQAIEARADQEVAQADLKAYARTLARRGKGAETGWPPEVLAEYVKTARLTASVHLAGIAKLGVGGDFDKLRCALEAAVAYVRGVNSKVAT